MTANINKHNFIKEPADSGLFCFYTDFTFALPKFGLCFGFLLVKLIAEGRNRAYKPTKTHAPGK